METIRQWTHRFFPPLYIAYRTDLSEGSEVVHNSLRERYELGDKEVHEAISGFSRLTTQAKNALEKGTADQLGKLLDENFDLRDSIMKISKANKKMVEMARSVGASAKFTGSGGAIIGTYLDDNMYEELVKKLEKKGIKVFKPEIISYKTHKI